MKAGNRPLVRRLIFIDEQIRTNKYPNGPELATELEVTDRTIRRDLAFLRDQLGAPLEFDTERNGFYYSQPSFQLSLMQLTEGELIALFVAERILASLQGTPFEQPLSQALNRLTELLPGAVSVNLQEFSSVLSVIPTAVAEQDVAIYGTLSHAVMNQETLEIRYWTAERNVESVRKVNPYHLTLLDGTWYLIAYCWQKEQTLMFAVQRIREVQVTGGYFPEPEDFDIHTYLGDSFRGVRGSGESHTIRLRFPPDSAGRVREKTWHHTQKLQDNPDGSLEMTLQVSDLADIKRWILWWGKDCEVLEPELLRSLLREELLQMRQTYSA